MSRIMVLAPLAFVLAACGGGGEAGQGGTTASTTTAPTGTAAATGGCRDVEQPEPKPAGSERPPTESLDPAKTYRVVVRTNCGDFTILLDPKAAPKTTASFVKLAESDFYDDTFFHRIVPGFVIQGGDPTGTGSGGPGYSTVDTPARSTRYTKGVVAMAKTAAEAPGTSGSQFFVVTSADAGLPPDYAVIGKVTGGLDVVDRIGRLGDANQQPTRPVVIEDVAVEFS